MTIMPLTEKIPDDADIHWCREYEDRHSSCFSDVLIDSENTERHVFEKREQYTCGVCGMHVNRAFLWRNRIYCQNCLQTEKNQIEWKYQ